MKKVFALFASVAFVALVACGPSAEEKAAAEKARQDSINAAMEKAAADSAAAAQAAMEQARQDSLNMAMEQAKADSIAMAEEAAKAKTKSKPKAKPTPKVEDKRPESVKQADDKVKSKFGGK